ncbi:hypothetical protein HG535_0A01430 [Zygotorulaspora mrakii]|uniref:Zn(2)-C6 fungal-type domain-containing protein n=1 Tax=Zygotorulaspora mrakii TaxID=42260 RepID=A0A7H9AV78_ZYGMR|nr:uncharacterized protein HG535_0A01430 [Zygotorulaspora mrakii]QLG70205.1 hypothetical protein HG535_0A01430 [Zygotorulaspora mrakii]
MARARFNRPKLIVLSVDSSTKRLRAQNGRVSKACDLCRMKKKKCDGLQPCSQCKPHKVACTYSGKCNRGSAASLSSGARETGRTRSPMIKNLVDERSGPLSPALVKRFTRGGSTDEDNSVTIALPEKEVALKLIQKTWDNVCVLFRFLYRPSIFATVDELYDSWDLLQLSTVQEKELSLIYSVMAVGALFTRRDLDKTDVAKRDFYEDEGYNYFVTAQSLINITSINDIYSIQTMFMLTMFLQCSGNLKKCYSYIGIALRAVITEGLHRKNSLVGPTPIEDETKKRLFWSVYKVDVYMSCVLGLPRSISDSAINQAFPNDVDDERITEEGIMIQEFGKISSCGMNNEHTKLMLIMARIHESLYPVLKWDEKTYMKIINFQEQLDQWLLKLPVQLHPSYGFYDEKTKDYYYKPNRLLYLDYLLTKIILHKPFIHYISIDAGKSSIYEFQHSMAKNCIRVAHEVIDLSNQMIENNLLSGSYWFSIHTIFFSVTCLMFYQHQINLGLIAKKDSIVEKNCDLGIRNLLKLKDSTSAGQRSFIALNSIFKEFNKKTTDAYLRVMANLNAQNAHDQEREMISIRQIQPPIKEHVPVSSSTSDPPGITDELLDQLLMDFDIPISNILPDFELTSFFPKPNDDYSLS